MATDSANRALIAQRIARSVASNYVGRFIGLGLWFVLTPFILRELGPVRYGLWAVIGSLIGFSSLLDLGIGDAVTRYVAQHVARQDFHLARGLVATALRIYTLIGLALIVASFIAALAIHGLGGTTQTVAGDTAGLVILIGLSAGISIPLSIARSVLLGLQRFDITNLVDTSGTFVSAAATIIVLLLGFGVPGMLAINVPTSVLAFGASAWFVRRVAPELRFGWSGASRSFVGPVLGFSWPLLATRVASQLQTRTDEIVIGLFLPISAVTPYSLARKLSELAQVLASQFVKVLLPLASQLDARNDQTGLQSLYVATTRATLMIFAPVAAVLIVLARPILLSWVGPPYGDAAILVVILALASLMDVSQWPGALILQGMGRHRPLAPMAIGNGLANLALSVVLVQAIGVVGVALATLVPMTAEALLLVMPYALRVIGVRPADVARRVVWPVFAPAVPTVMLLYLLRELATPTSAPSTAVIALVGIATYLLTYFRVGASAAERETYHRVLVASVRFAETRFRWF